MTWDWSRSVFLTLLIFRTCTILGRCIKRVIAHKKLPPPHCYHICSNSRDVYLDINHYEHYSPKMLPVANIWGPGSWTIYKWYAGCCVTPRIRCCSELSFHKMATVCSRGHIRVAGIGRDWPNVSFCAWAKEMWTVRSKMCQHVIRFTFIPCRITVFHQQFQEIDASAFIYRSYYVWF
jgi:hypothetical protein